MKRCDSRTNDLLSRTVDRFLFHHEKTNSDNPIVAEMAEKICDVELWEMWTLTQE